MPLTKQGKKVKRKMQEHYGAKKGEQVFYATAHKKGKQWHRSPESYDDRALGENPPRRHYSAEQEDLHARESKKAGGVPAAVQQHTGTESPRTEVQTKVGAGKGSRAAKRSWPSGVNSFTDDET